jgi:hypothetical protein
MAAPAAFDPDAYLAAPAAAPATTGFDPDAYLAETTSNDLSQYRDTSPAAGLAPLEFLGRTAYGAVAAPVAGLAGIAQGAYNVGREALGMKPGMPAADVVENVTGALGEPLLKGTKMFERDVGRVLGPVQETVRAPGRMVAEAGYPVTGAVLSAVPETSLALLAPETRGAVRSVATTRLVRPTAASATAAAGAGAGGPAVGAAMRAQQWVSQNTNLTWDQIPQRLKTILENVAQDATQLGKLDPKSLERQATLERAGITKATKGQLTREPLQQRTEQLARATSGGEPLRQLDLENNRILGENVKALAKGAKAEGPVQVGRSVQTVLRDRLAAAKKNVTQLYRKAKTDGELQGPVDIQPLLDFVDTNIAPQSVSWLKNAIESIKARNTTKVGGTEVTETRPVTLEQIEEAIRKEAVRQSKNADGSIRFQAGEAIKVIDSMTEGLGGTSFKAARAARRAMGEEFENTQAVAQLVKNRKMSQDRAVKLEDTWRRTVINGGIEDLKNVYTSLRRGGVAGRQAWRDLRGATADYILGKATGGGPLGLKTAAGDLNVTWDGLRRAVQDIGPEKMEFLFGKVGAKQMNDIVEAAQILKTEAPTGVKGSPTLDKLLTLLDKFGAVGGKYVGSDVLAGAVKGVAKLSEVGEAGRTVRKAMESPLEAAQSAVQRGQTLQSLGRGTTAGSLTLGGMRPDETQR